MTKKKVDKVKPKWKFINKYDISVYRCGLHAGNRVRLRHDLVIMDLEGNPTGTVYPAGEIWLVLPGASKDPNVVFLLQENNQRHTWDDNQSIYDMFELVDNSEEEKNRE